MKPKKYIQVERIPKKQKTVLTEQDKIARLYAKAKELNVKIGVADEKNNSK